MSVTTPETPVPVAAAPVPEPIQDAEQAVEQAAPTVLKPAVTAVEDGFDKVLAEAESQAPAVEAQAAAVDPALGKLGADAQEILTGHLASPQQLVYDVQGGFKEAKAGYKTTEFWLSGIVIVLSQVGALDLPGQYGKTITTAAATVAYALSRGFAKSGVPSPV
jgi:hypothetical protein